MEAAKRENILLPLLSVAFTEACRTVPHVHKCVIGVCGIKIDARCVNEKNASTSFIQRFALVFLSVSSGVASGSYVIRATLCVPRERGRKREGEKERDRDARVVF